MIVHIPILGTPWLLYHVFAKRKNDLDSQAWKNIYSLLIIFGIITAIAYFTGPEAADWTKVVLDTYNQELVENHALWGRIAFVVQGMAAFVGIMGWSNILQEETPHHKIPTILAITLVLNTIVIIYAAHLGGLIRRIDFL